MKRCAICGKDVPVPVDEAGQVFTCSECGGFLEVQAEGTTKPFVAETSVEDRLEVFLDASIRNWQTKARGGSPAERKVAACYVDAYQTVRLFALGSALGPE